MKRLIKKFSFKELEKEAKRQHWKIPTADEVRRENIEYDAVWVSDTPEDPGDVDTHACLYNRVLDIVEVCNKNHMHNCVVTKVYWKEKKDLVDAVDPLIDRVLYSLSYNDYEKVMGRMAVLSAKIEKDECVDSMVEIALLTKALELAEKS